MQSHMAILIAYCIGMKKDHQTLLNFAILAEKWQKRTFSYKVACKKFSWSGQRGGGIALCPFLKYATVVMTDTGDVLFSGINIDDLE